MLCFLAKKRCRFVKTTSISEHTSLFLELWKPFCSLTFVRVADVSQELCAAAVIHFSMLQLIGRNCEAHVLLMKERPHNQEHRSMVFPEELIYFILYSGGSRLSCTYTCPENGYTGVCETDAAKQPPHS